MSTKYIIEDLTKRYKSLEKIYLFLSVLNTVLLLFLLICIFVFDYYISLIIFAINISLLVSTYLINKRINKIITLINKINANHSSI
mgnify:CR=1 FL=1